MSSKEEIILIKWESVLINSTAWVYESEFGQICQTIDIHLQNLWELYYAQLRPQMEGRV